MNSDKPDLLPPVIPAEARPNSPTHQIGIPQSEPAEARETPVEYVLACRYCGGELFADGDGGWTCPRRGRHTQENADGFKEVSALQTDAVSDERVVSEREVREGQVALPAPDLAVTPWIEQRLRQEWWSGHGCSFHALYGDDGEMQCNAATCMRDFKRDPMEVLRDHVEARRLAIAAASADLAVTALLDQDAETDAFVAAADESTRVRAVTAPRLQRLLEADA